MKEDASDTTQAEAMMLFDTDVLIWYFRGNEGAASFIESVPYEERATSSLCTMELIQGCQDKRELRTIKSFLQKNISTIVRPDRAVAEKAMALLEVYTLSAGLRTVDSIIAASAMVSRCALVTANTRHFSVISGLTVVRFIP